MVDPETLAAKRDLFPNVNASPDHWEDAGSRFVSRLGFFYTEPATAGLLFQQTKIMNDSTKPNNVVFERRDGYLRATIPTTHIDRFLAIDHMSEIMRKCSEKRDKRLLIRCDIPLSQADSVITVVNELVRLSRGMRIAFVSVNESAREVTPACFDHGRDGGADFGFFTDGKKAEDWIVAGDLPEKRRTS